MRCVKCGKEYDGKFCPQCGTPAGQTVTPPPVVVQAVPPKKKGHGCLISILIFFIIIFGGIALALNMGKSVQKSISGVEDDSEYITLEEYNQIDTGMTYDEVVEIVGSAGTVSSEVESGGYKIVIVTWYGNGLTGSNANVTFTNDAVTAKAQVGLK